MRFPWAATFFAIFIGCGSGDSTAGGSPGAQKCQSACQRLASCSVANDICAPGGCELWSDRWRPEFVDGYFGCLLDPQTPCTSAGSESCYASGVSTLTMRQSDLDYSGACMKKRTDCMNNPYPDDYCFGYFLSDAWLANAQACLAKSCDEVGACVRAVFKP